MRFTKQPPDPDYWLRWRRVFAWSPVKLGAYGYTYAWLEWVERREWSCLWESPMGIKTYESTPEYRAIEPAIVPRETLNASPR